MVQGAGLVLERRQQEADVADINGGGVGGIDQTKRIAKAYAYRQSVSVQNGTEKGTELK